MKGGAPPPVYCLKVRERGNKLQKCGFRPPPPELIPEYAFGRKETRCFRCYPLLVLSSAYFSLKTTSLYDSLQIWRKYLSLVYHPEKKSISFPLYMQAIDFDKTSKQRKENYVLLQF